MNSYDLLLGIHNYINRERSNNIHTKSSTNSSLQVDMLWMHIQDKWRLYNSSKFKIHTTINKRKKWNNSPFSSMAVSFCIYMFCEVYNPQTSNLIALECEFHSLIMGKLHPSKKTDFHGYLFNVMLYIKNTSPKWRNMKF